ncbi:MAG: hypothetical protein ACLRK9_14635 [Roseburia hominis]|jgi:phosphoglycerate dehydrogenase
MSRNDNGIAILDGQIGGKISMEIVIKTKKKKPRITRDKGKGGGIIRIDDEACDILEGIADKLESEISIKELASTLIRSAANNAVIREEEEEE